MLNKPLSVKKAQQFGVSPNFVAIDRAIPTILVGFA
jgi:hypothetical protein